MKFDFNDHDDKMCRDLQNAKLYYISYGDEILWSVGGKAFYDSVLKNMEDVMSGRTEVKLQVDFSHDYDLDIKI